MRLRRVPRIVPPDGELSPDERTWTSGTGQMLIDVHSRELCQGRHCVIHNPSDHAMRSFPTHFRQDTYLMERICPHGVGHPDPDDLEFWLSRGLDWKSVHGCDGCCNEEVHEQLKKTELEHAEEQRRSLTHEEELERVALVRERDENERRHREIMIRLTQLEKKRLGRAYAFQNSHEHT